MARPLGGELRCIPAMRLPHGTTSWKQPQCLSRAFDFNPRLYVAMTDAVPASWEGNCDTSWCTYTRRFVVIGLVVRYRTCPLTVTKHLNRMKALVLTTATRSVRVADRPIPTPASGEVLIRVEAIALNPVDSLYVAEPVARQPERIIGTDFAGVVVGLARDLEDAQVQDKRPVVGARVAGFLQGGGYGSSLLLERWKVSHQPVRLTTARGRLPSTSQHGTTCCGRYRLPCRSRTLHPLACAG